MTEQSRAGSPDEQGADPEPTGGRGAGAADEGAGTGKAKYTPPISDEDQHPNDTQYPAPDDEVGIPDDPGKG